MRRQVAAHQQAFSHERDYWPIRGFLRDVLLADSLQPVCWTVFRWDYWRWHGIHNCEWQAIEEVVVVWRDEAGRIVAVANAEGAGNLFLQVAPGHRQAAMLTDMLAAGERTMVRQSDGQRTLDVWLPASRPEWQRPFEDAGYRPTDNVEQVRAVRLTETPVEAAVPAGYRLRMLLPEDGTERGLLSWSVFHPLPDGTLPMSAADYGWIQRCPLWRRDLDLVAVAPDGSLAGFVTMWFNDTTRTAMVEPMGVATEHRRRGVGKALLCEGLRRVRWLGAHTAYVGSYSAEAHALYASAGTHTVERLVAWRREWTPGSS